MITCITVITVLHRILRHVRSISHFGQARDLSIQFDGASENWNKYLLAYCHLLVASRAFDSASIYSMSHISAIIHLNSQSAVTGLSPGHTHEDVDAVFNVIAQALIGKGCNRGVNAVTIHSVPAFHNFLKNSVFKKGLTVVHR